VTKAMRTLIAAFALLFIVSGAVAADTVAELTRHSQALAATTEQRRSLSPASAAPEESLDRRGRAVVRLAREAEFYSQQARLLGDCLDASRAVQRSLAALREARSHFQSKRRFKRSAPDPPPGCSYCLRAPKSVPTLLTCSKYSARRGWPPCLTANWARSPARKSGAEGTRPPARS